MNDVRIRGGNWKYMLLAAVLIILAGSIWLGAVCVPEKIRETEEYGQELIRRYSENGLLESEEKRQAVLTAMEGHIRDNGRRLFVRSCTRLPDSLEIRFWLGGRFLYMPPAEGMK